MIFLNEKIDKYIESANKIEGGVFSYKLKFPNGWELNKNNTHPSFTIIEGGDGVIFTPNNINGEYNYDYMIKYISGIIDLYTNIEKIVNDTKKSIDNHFASIEKEKNDATEKIKTLKNEFNPFGEIVKKKDENIVKEKEAVKKNEEADQENPKSNKVHKKN